MRNEEGKGVFIVERLHQLSRKVVDVYQTLEYVWYYYTTVQRLYCTFKYYPVGIPARMAVRPVVPLRTFAQKT
jgi:hypothetical protein